MERTTSIWFSVLSTPSPAKPQMSGRSMKLVILKKFLPVIKDFAFSFNQVSHRLSDCPGSGNTKNIGSVTKVDNIVNGEGPFSKLGEAVYDDYWMYYLTKIWPRPLTPSVPTPTSRVIGTAGDRQAVAIRKRIRLPLGTIMITLYGGPE